MERAEQLKYCKVCKNQKFEARHGVICRLTDRPAEFEGTCDSYLEDTVLMEHLEISVNNVKAKTASQGQRFANHLLDLVFLLIFNIILGVFLGVFLAIFSPSSLEIFDEDSLLVNYLFAFVGAMIYYSFWEAATGRTIAKYITKTKVVDEYGNKPDLGTVLLRSLCRFIPFDAFSFLGADNEGWHDRFSKTRVVEI